MTGGTHVEGVWVAQWEFTHRESSVSTVEIRLLEKSGEVPSAVESWMSLGRINLAVNFDRGYFIPNTSLPTFEFESRVKEVQRNFCSRSYPLESCARPPSDILALNARVLESFRIRVVRRDPSESPLARWPRYGVIMALSAVSHF